MASTYSQLKIELIGTGDQAGTWGATTNVNLGTALEEAITGSANVTFASSNVALTLADTNASQTARNLRLLLTGTVSQTQHLFLPAIKKQYFIDNGLTFPITVANGSNSGATGTTVTIPAGLSAIVFNDGVNMDNPVSYIPALGNVTINGGNANALTLSNVSIISGSANNITSNASTFTNAVITNSTINGGSSNGSTYSNVTIVSGTANAMTLSNTAIGTPTSGNLAFCTVDGTNNVGYLYVPVNSQSAAYTAVAADSGKLILHPASDANARTFTIPANSSVPYPSGTVLSFVNMTSQAVTISITSDSMFLAGTGTSGNRTLAQWGVATATKVNATAWLISGTGLT